MRSLDTDAEAEKIQLEIYRRMSPEQRLEIGLELSALSRHLLREGIRMRHPEYSAHDVHFASIRALITPELFRAAYPGEPELDP